MTSTPDDNNLIYEDMWVEWIEDAILNRRINYHASSEEFGNVWRAELRNLNGPVVALKTFKNDSHITKEIVYEVNNIYSLKTLMNID